MKIGACIEWVQDDTQQRQSACERERERKTSHCRCFRQTKNRMFKLTDQHLNVRAQHCVPVFHLSK